VTLLEFLDRRGERRLERHKLSPPRPIDLRMFVGVLFFAGYYALVFSLRRGPPMGGENATLVKDAMLVLGPVVGMIAQALFRTDVKDEIATQNTGEAFRASRAQAEATKAAAETTPAAPDPKALRDGDKIELNKEEAATGLNREIQP
jgi:hypothetical protein